MEELLKKYTNNELEIEELEKQMTMAIAQLKNSQTALKEANEKIKQEIMTSMEQNEVKKYENNFIAITYVAPTTKNTVDTKKLKEEYNEVYNKCLKTSDVKASLRIKIKDTPTESIPELVEELTI